jgi:aminoglycoside phosphotransferase (APT) family kinase protein
LAAYGVRGLHPLSGGASSLTYAGERAGRGVVVKVAPPGVEPTGHRDVLRQARIIRALARTQVPVPQVLIDDAGDPPDEPPLFVMTRLAGDSLEPLFDAGTQTIIPNAVVGERFRHAAAVMAQLHGLVPEYLGVGEEPVPGPEAEIDRWSRTLSTVDQEPVAGWREVADRLRASVPEALPAAVVHGDFRLGNLLAVGDRITAVIDWEIWSLGDPRIDAGWFLVNSDPRTYGRPTAYAGVTPPLDELADIYARTLGRAVPKLAWFQALACFKSAATWSLIVKHNRRRPAPDPEFDAMAPALPRLLSRAADLLG